MTNSVFCAIQTRQLRTNISGRWFLCGSNPCLSNPASTFLTIWENSLFFLVYFLEYAENAVFCPAWTLLREKIQRECALCVVGTHCSGKCGLVPLLDYGDISLPVQFELIMQGNTGGVYSLCSRYHSVGGRGTCCLLCSTNSLLREAQTSAVPRI